MFYQFLPMSKFKINWILVVFAGTFTSALSKRSSLKKNLDTFHQPIKCQDERKDYWPIRLLLLSQLLNVSKQLKLAGIYYVLRMAQFPAFSLYLFESTQTFKWSLQLGFPRQILRTYFTFYLYLLFNKRKKYKMIASRK